MTSKIFGAAFLIVVGGLGGYVLASNPPIMSYFHLSNPNQETKYRLQERCADRAKTFYEEEYAPINQNGDDRIVILHESHYNARLNACFIFAQVKVYQKDLQEWKIISTEVRDVNTRQTYASYSDSTCEVRGTTCKSEAEWWKLVTPYIEELATP